MISSVRTTDDVYKCGVKALFQDAYLYKSKFKQSSCVLGISVGQPAHEGDKFMATINAINNEFKECIVMVCDSLQRHSMVLGAEENVIELHKQARFLGKQWIARNEGIINGLTIPYKIIRWDYWLNHPLFTDAQRKIDDLYLYDYKFKKAVDDAAKIFAKREQKRSVDADYNYNKVFNASRLYLKEECAAILLLAAEKIDFEIYPGRRVQAMEYVYKTLIVPQYGETFLPLSIKFKKKSK